MPQNQSVAKPGWNLSLQALKSLFFSITKNSGISQVLIYTHGPRLASFLSGSLPSFISLHCSCFQKISICCFPGKGISYKLQHSRFPPKVVAPNSHKLLLYYCISQFWRFDHPQGPKQAAWGLGSFLKLQSNCWSRLRLFEGLTRAGGPASWWPTHVDLVPPFVDLSV